MSGRAGRLLRKLVGLHSCVRLRCQILRGMENHLRWELNVADHVHLKNQNLRSTRGTWNVPFVAEQSIG